MSIPEEDRFKDRLTARQRKRFYPIDRPSDWRAVKAEFLQEVREAKTMSFNTESINDGASLHYAVFGTYKGMTLVIDIVR